MHAIEGIYKTAQKLKCLDATQIKYLAMGLMVLDHIHQMFVHVDAPIWLTMVGRVVFPLFLFITADSFYYTSDRRKLLLRLYGGAAVMAFGSSIIQRLLPNPDVVLMNNAFMTFLLTGLYIVFYDRLVDGIKTKQWTKILTSIGLFLLPVLGAVPLLAARDFITSGAIPEAAVPFIFPILFLIPNVVTVEGGVGLVVLGLLFYIFRSKRLVQVGILIALSLALGIRGEFQDIQWLMGFAAIPMLMYNGERGRGDKWLFYIFYPAHIYILYIISTLFFS